MINRIIIIPLLLVVSQSLSGSVNLSEHTTLLTQQDTVTVSVNYNNIPFKAMADDLKNRYNVDIYYG
ncbi:MAG: hypothetical protein LC649_01135 [Bacteroidales bacterium]|nr:hypothetical protein [Bacteroidales bacterium]